MLKRVEREKLQDCLLLIQSVRNILCGFQRTAIPDLDELDKCFRDADQTITKLLRG